MTNAPNFAFSYFQEYTGDPGRILRIFRSIVAVCVCAYVIESSGELGFSEQVPKKTHRITEQKRSDTATDKCRFSCVCIRRGRRRRFCRLVVRLLLHRLHFFSRVARECGWLRVIAHTHKRQLIPCMCRRAYATSNVILCVFITHDDCRRASWRM